MSVNLVNPPYVTFKDVDGDPLESGYIYIGNPGLNAEASPKTAYFDEAKTIVATQPIRTIGGFPVYLGSPAKIYVEGDYSIVVKDRRLQLVQSSLSSVVLPGPDGVRISFDTLADLNAATVPDGVEFVMAAGLLFKQDPSGTAQTSNGGAKKWSPLPTEATPLHWGAAGDGVTDDTAAVKGWVAFMNGAYNNPGFSDGVPRITFDLGGYLYGVSEKIAIPSSGTGVRSCVLQNGSFVALAGGNGFDNNSYDAYAGNLEEGYVGWKDPVIEWNSAYGSIQRVNVHGQDIANGIVVTQGRVVFDSCMIRRMPDVGVWLQSGSDTRFNDSLVQQFNGTNDDLSDQSIFTAIGLLVENSDCKAADSTFSWCLKNYVATAGIQQIYDCHFFGGTTPPRTNSTLIEYQGGSTLICQGSYLDNGKVILKRDRCTFRDNIYLLDSADVTQTALFFIHCNDASVSGGYPRTAISGGHASTFSGAPALVELVDDAFAWAADAPDWVGIINSESQQDIEAHVTRKNLYSVNTEGSDFVANWRSNTSRSMHIFSNSTQTSGPMAIGSSDDSLWARIPSGTDFRVGRLVASPALTVNGADDVISLSLPTYADNASAVSGGLSTGNVYQTATGELRIVV